MDKFQEAMSLSVFRTVPWHRGEDWFGMIAQYCKLDIEGGVEHHVGILLIGLDPFLLAFTYGRPLANGFAGSEGSLVVVAYDAA